MRARFVAPELSDEALVARHASLLDRCARTLARKTGGIVPPDDLWSAGALGLIEAWRKFEASRGVAFETFAEHRIRGAMLDELRKLDHLPRRLRGDTERLRKAREKLRHELGHEPSDEALCASLELPIEQLAELEALAHPPLPLIGALPIASDDPGADELLQREQLSRRLAQAIGALPERLAILLSLHYVEGLTYREIAGVLEVSEPRVCQLHRDAVKQLREVMGTE